MYNIRESNPPWKGGSYINGNGLRYKGHEYGACLASLKEGLEEM